jgi:hypothetical protein
MYSITISSIPAVMVVAPQFLPSLLGWRVATDQAISPEMEDRKVQIAIIIITIDLSPIMNISDYIL